MSTRMQSVFSQSLQLPPEFEDLTGVIRNDLRVIVSIIGDRADERLMLSRGQSQQLRRALWDSLVSSVNQTLLPHSAEHR